MVSVVGISQFLKILSRYLTVSEIAHHRVMKPRSSELEALQSSHLILLDSREDFERIKKIKALSRAAVALIASDLDALRLPKSFASERDQLLICNIRDLREILKVLRLCDESNPSLEKISRVLSQEIFEDTRSLLPSLTRLESQIFHILSHHRLSRGISDFQEAGLPINAHRLRDHVLTLRRKLLTTRFEIQTVKDIGYRLNFGFDSSSAIRENRIDSGLPSLEGTGELILE